MRWDEFKLWTTQVRQDVRMGLTFFSAMRRLRKDHPEMNLFDRLDHATMQINLGTAEARLTYTLKHGSVHDAPKIKERA